MIESNHSQVCKKNTGSVNLQDGPFDYNHRKISVEDSFLINIQTFWFNKLYWKLTAIYLKNFNNFCYLLPKSCFTEQLSMHHSEWY